MIPERAGSADRYTTPHHHAEQFAFTRAPESPPARRAHQPPKTTANFSCVGTRGAFSHRPDFCELRRHSRLEHRIARAWRRADTLPIRRIIDPDYPSYGYPPFEDAAASENYIGYIEHRIRRGEKVEQFSVGARDQLRLEHGSADVPFQIRNLACKGNVWDRPSDTVTQRFPAPEKLTRADYPNVNAGSSAIHLSFGAFGYFAAGDLTDWADAGTRPWMGALTLAAQSAGPVSVALLPHHGLFDASGSATVRALAAKVWVISAWHASHPSITTLERLFNERLFAGPRDVYATGLAPEADITQGRLTRKLTSRDGHVIVRVAADGNSFRTIVTSAKDEGDRVRHASPVILS